MGCRSLGEYAVVVVVEVVVAVVIDFLISPPRETAVEAIRAVLIPPIVERRERVLLSSTASTASIHTQIVAEMA
jgi:hypothetical protein